MQQIPALEINVREGKQRQGCGEEETVLPLWPQREGPVGSELSRSDDKDADGRDCFLSHTLSCEGSL